ncbi:MAG: hypothetical protein WDN49_18030 [Acetobacteraceae bacterium]
MLRPGGGWGGRHPARDRVAGDGGGRNPSACSALTSFAGLDRSYVRTGEPAAEPRVHSAFPLLGLPVLDY